LLHHVIKSIKKELKEKVGLVTASGLMIWGIKNLTIPLSIKTAFKLQDKEYQYDVIIKPTKSLQVEALLKSKDGMDMVFQMYNNKIKDVLRDRKME
jgi:proline dehydrogenase